MSAALQAPLPPEALALIKEGTPKPQTQTPIVTVVATTVKPQEPTAPKPASQTDQPPKPKAPKEKPEETVSLVSMNFRVPSSIPQALLKASSERKMKKIRPYTQQDIVAEALTDWLRKGGYFQ
jgi:hypothetical protein